MADERAVLFGGPLDGHETAPRSLEFIYVAPAKGKLGVRVFDKPGPGRLLYRRESADQFVYAGDTHVRCEDCETIQPRSKEACLCGGKLIRA